MASDPKDLIKSMTATALAGATAAGRGEGAAGIALAAGGSFLPYVLGRCIPGFLERRERS